MDTSTVNFLLSTLTNLRCPYPSLKNISFWFGLSFLLIFYWFVIYIFIVDYLSTLNIKVGCHFLKKISDLIPVWEPKHHFIGVYHKLSLRYNIVLLLFTMQSLASCFKIHVFSSWDLTDLSYRMIIFVTWLTKW